LYESTASITTLAAADKLILLSGTEARELREQNKSQSGEIGITIGSQAGFGVYVSAAMAKGKGSGDGVNHKETIVGSSRGGDTVGTGVQIIGNRVIGQVGGGLILRSERDSNKYHKRTWQRGST